MSVLKRAFIMPKKPETFSAAGQYKIKEHLVPGREGTPDQLMNLVKVPLKKSPSELLEQDPVDKMLQAMMMMQMISAQHGGKPMFTPQHMAPLLAADLVDNNAPKQAADRLESLLGDGGIPAYAKKIIKDLKPEHYTEAGGTTAHETLRNLLEDVIPRTVLREHASRIGRGDVDTGQRIIETYLAPSLQTTGEPLPNVLKRMLSEHIKGMHAADKSKALLDVDLESAGKSEKQPGVADWLSLIKQHAPKKEQDPTRFQQSAATFGDAQGKYGSLRRARHGTVKQAGRLGRFLAHPLTLGAMGMAIPYLLPAALSGIGDTWSSLAKSLGDGEGTVAALTNAAGAAAAEPTGSFPWSALIPGALGGVGGAALGRRLSAPRAPNLSGHAISPFYTPSEGGKARALTVTPDMLSSVIAGSPQVGALTRAAGPDILDALPLALRTGIGGSLGRLNERVVRGGRGISSANQLLKHIAYATHGDVSSPEAIRQHIETITGQQGANAGHALAHALRAGSGMGGAMGSMSAPQSSLGQMKVPDNFMESMRTGLVNHLLTPTPNLMGGGHQ